MNSDAINTMTPLCFDIIIVGAGIAGAALACALQDSSFTIALVESQSLSSQWPEQSASINGFDSRVSALTQASRHFLDDLGVWTQISQRRVSPYQKMHVWDAEGTASIDFIAAEINQSELGYIVENRLTTTALLEKIRLQKNVQIIDAVKISELKTPNETLSSPKEHILELDDGRELCSSLVVAADGANSFMRSQAMFSTREWDYGHHAIVTTVRTSYCHQNTAWQRFMIQGPLAFLPLKGEDNNRHFCSIVWSVLPQYAKNLMALNDHEFMQSLGDAFEHQLGDVLEVGQRFCFPLRQRHATEYAKSGIVLVGDAAHTIHPLAGQGINLGLLDVKVLAEELMRAQVRQLNPGSLHVLSRYQRRRKTDNLVVMAAMEGFKRLFAQSALPIRWARNTGIRWLDNKPVLKHQIMREAMGL